MISSSASWIAMPESQRGRSAPLLRKEFEVAAEPVAASLSICGLGFYEAHLNGRRVGDRLLDPAQTDYEFRCLYSKYDVKDLVKPGVNAIGVMLGDGWFNQDLVWNREMSYGHPRLAASLRVEFKDGSALEVSTDSSWLCARGPVVSSNVYAGESYDARMERPGWDSPGLDCDGGKWWTKWLRCEVVEAPKGRLEEQAIPPVKAVELLRPVELSEPQPGTYVVDFGRNFSGWLRIELSALRGTCVRLRFAEALGRDGMLDSASTGVFATNVEQVDSYVCKGGGLETWEPRFTYHGFRYVEISGWPGKPSLDALSGVVVHTALKPVGVFKCSDPRLNLLHEMALWTHRSNIHGFPEDCPVRERCGWLGDAHVICEYSLYNFEGDAFWLKYLDDIESSRMKNGGLPAFVAPGRRSCGTASPDWMAALILIPWRHYLHYGRLEALERHWDGMKFVMSHFEKLSKGGLLHEGLGDWFDPGERAQPSYTPPVKTSTMIFGQCADTMSKAAKALGLLDEAALYSSWSVRIREAFRNAFYDPAKRSFGSQTADSMALLLGFAPEGEEQALADAIAKDVNSRDCHFTVGIMGLKTLFEALSRYGHGELALALLRQDSYPSFGHLIKRGATTLWEFWGEPEVEAAHGPRSLSHPMMGGYDAWFFNTLAGICPDPETPGFTRFLLAPHPVRGLSWLKASYESPAGLIESEWTFSGDGVFEWTATVPPGASALAKLPGDSSFSNLGPGKTVLRRSL